MTWARTSEIYIDRGCEVSPRCLECPLSACKYDDVGPHRSWLAKNRLFGVKAELAKGDLLKDIAERHGITERTLYRYRAHLKREGERL